MLISATFVSTSFTVGAAITNSVDPAVLTFVRFVCAAIFLVPYVAWKHGLSIKISFIFRCSAISATLVIFFWCMFLSLRYTTALNTSVIFTLTPSIAGLYALFLLREKMDRNALIALGCGMFGAVWVIFRGDLSNLLDTQWNKGDLIFFVGCLAMGLYTVLIKLLHRDEPMIVMTLWILITGACWLLLFGYGEIVSNSWWKMPNITWVGILYLAIFSTILTFFITQYSILFIGPTKVMAYSYLYPAMVLILDFSFGHGLPDKIVYPGVIIVVAAMLVLFRAEET